MDNIDVRCINFMSIKDWSTPKKIISGCLILVVLGAGGCGTLIFGVFSLLKSSDAYTAGLQHVQSNEEVKKLIGTPIEPGFMMSGSINLSGSSGNADISFPVSGPNGSGHVYVIGTKREGTWQYSTMNFIQESSSEKINLLPAKND